MYVFVEGLSYGYLFFGKKALDLKYEPVDTLSSKQKKDLGKFLSGKNNYWKFRSKLGWVITLLILAPLHSPSWL